MTDEERPPSEPPIEHRRPLRGRPSAGQIIGGVLAGLEHLIAGRPKPVAQVEEPYTDAWASLDGMTVDGLDEPVERPEPPDRSGARL